MRVLYRRLKAVGFDSRFVRESVLPDWWDDSLAENPANAAIAEMSVARMLGFSVSALRDDGMPLTLPSTSDARLKRTTDVVPAVLAPAVRVAERVVGNLQPCLVGLPSFTGATSASSARATILEHAPDVGLAQLVDFAWRCGIVVAQLADRPAKTGKLHGVAMVCGDRPAIVLTAKSDSPPWLAYHLGHELGHVLLGHVRVGAEPILDANEHPKDSDPEEQQANAFALELLTGFFDLSFSPAYGLTSAGLALKAPVIGKKYRINPGTLALAYGYTAGRIPVAQGALKQLGLDTGAHKILSDRLRSHLDEDLPETVAQAAALAGVR